ncbi:MAG TPA: 50S ribosomal protein L13 [Candidatus Pacearchaeota archaeon]|nr:MAG: 50S ribosomal protein L13 [Candidatus Pacearchaeota archaeon ex4484_31]HDI03171.1 50S ribosomal protein L13 [Candidatus Pacearchaeota archaeon]
MEEIIIDAKDCVLGRLASFIAKQARKGFKVIVLNAGKAIVVGKPKKILEKYLSRFRLGGTSQKGPFYSRTVIGIWKRAVRGMIGWKKASGKKAFKLIKFYEDVPKEYKNKETVNVDRFKKKVTDFITVEKLSRLIRQK